MQSKISSFFKPSASVAPKSPIFRGHGQDDELTIWEKKEHRFFNTYTRRAQKSHSVSETLKKPICDNSCFKPESKASGRPINNKKRSYAQFHLDLGQSDFNLHTCSTCGINYSPGERDDEKAHKAFHKDYTHGIPFKGWCNERLVPMPYTEGGRIILVLDCDPPVYKNKVEEVVKMMEIELGSGWTFHKSCQVYLFISSRRIAGCLIAEPIKQAFKLSSRSENGGCDGTSIKRIESQKSATLQFGVISLKREVNKKAPSFACSVALDGNLGAIICEREAVPAVCGIRAIWVTPSNRRKHIASQLLDAVRKSFCMGFVLERSQLAFSQPTSAGNMLAFRYFGTRSFLVYKTNNLDS
ncbi:protein CHROMOSOME TRANSMISSION FIDELITY 7-like isoform X1 [Juglans microcarpa x Juglans regia]|uniref:protein CHROMOSOME TRANSMISSION FIDELITY 7-like isoform X1 n=1 Tax=Juglans microcarpa x Juglans regia TaxID=2249226 RepID=UPI001B7DEB12|nr:protein CHROMOSOME TRANSMISSION FIDELITY 7-like isoform X1 [Juglans microcarpa x Juglans regia]